MPNGECGACAVVLFGPMASPTAAPSAAPPVPKATLATYLDLSQLTIPEDLYDLHVDIMLPASAENWSAYHADKDIKEVVDLYLGKYQEHLDALPPDFFTTPVTVTIPAAQPATTPPPPVKPKRAPGVKKPKAAASAQPASPAKPSRPAAKEVEEISVATRLIKRFVGVVNREVELAALIRLLKALQQAVLKKLVRATSGFAPEVREIQATLVDIANKAKPGQVRLDVPDDKLAVYISIAGGEAVFESVRLLSRYIRQQGLTPSEKWAKAYIKSAERFLSSEKAKLDPLRGNVELAKKRVEGYQNHGKMIPDAMDLRGLSGLFGLDGLGCTPGNPCKTPCKARSGKAGSTKHLNGLGELEAELALMRRQPDARQQYAYVPQGADASGFGSLESVEKPGVQKSKRKGQPLMSGSELMRVSYPTYTFSEPISTLTGKVAKGFLAMLHGRPGQGKSTFALQWACDAARLGKVLYVSSEEYGSYTLKDKLTRCGGPREGLDFAASLDNVALGGYQFLFVDSVNHAGLQLEEVRRLKEKHTGLSIVLVMQSTKEGQFKGNQEWAHETDIVVSVDKGRASTEKNRYAPLTSIQVF